jgi:TonB family protein
MLSRATSTGRPWRLAMLASLVCLVAGCAGGARPLELISGAGAIYPPNARDAGLEGYVVVRYDIDTEGRVRNARVVAADPPEVFDESAVQAVSRWRFRPPERDGQPQPVSGLESRLDFTTDGADAYDDY